ncbi:MAG: TIGR02300 family protein [Nitrospinae bacterium]|nr:TIGR02300 family protein [Nitrospinota bacterium]
MVKPEWGTRYICYKCSARFYDMNKPAPICPKCGADQTKAPPKLSASAPVKPRPRAVLPDEVDVEEKADDEFGEMGEIGLDEIEADEGEEEV